MKGGGPKIRLSRNGPSIFLHVFRFEGHEIAAHSITHRGPEEWWGNNATINDWFEEMVGQANILNRYSGIESYCWVLKRSF